MSHGNRGHDKGRHWTSAYHKHGKRRGKMARAWSAFMKLVSRKPHNIEPMQDPKDFFKGRR